MASSRVSGIGLLSRFAPFLFFRHSCAQDVLCFAWTLVEKNPSGQSRMAPYSLILTSRNIEPSTPFSTK